MKRADAVRLVMTLFLVLRWFIFRVIIDRPFSSSLQAQKSVYSVSLVCQTGAFAEEITYTFLQTQSHVWSPLCCVSRTQWRARTYVAPPLGRARLLMRNDMPDMAADSCSLRNVCGQSPQWIAG